MRLKVFVRARLPFEPAPPRRLRWRLRRPLRRLDLMRRIVGMRRADALEFGRRRAAGWPWGYLPVPWIWQRVLRVILMRHRLALKWHARRCRLRLRRRCVWPSLDRPAGKRLLHRCAAFHSVRVGLVDWTLHVFANEQPTIPRWQRMPNIIILLCACPLHAHWWRLIDSDFPVNILIKLVEHGLLMHLSRWWC